MGEIPEFDRCPNCGLRAVHIDDVQERPVGWPSNTRFMCPNEHVWFDNPTGEPIAALSVQQRRGAYLRKLSKWRRELRADLDAYEHGAPLE